MGNSHITEAVESIPIVCVKTVTRETLKQEFVCLFFGPDGISLEGNRERTSLTASKPASPKELFKNATQRGKHFPRRARALHYPSTPLTNRLQTILQLNYNRHVLDCTKKSN